jgi:hypothetical protein
MTTPSALFKELRDIFLTRSHPSYPSRVRKNSVERTRGGEDIGKIAKEAPDERN